MNDQGLTPPKLQPIDPVLIVAFALCAVLIGGLYFVMIAPSGGGETVSEESGPEQSYRFRAMTIDRARLAAARDQRQGEAHLERAPQEIARLQELVREANLMQFPADPPLTGEAVDKIEREIIYAANEVIPATGFPGFVTAGESMFEACLQGLEELLLAVRRGNVEMERARQDPPTPRFKTYRENCGNALDILIEHGLVTPEGRWRQAHGPTIFELLMRFRWAHMIHTHMAARVQLPRYEYELLLRWRVEDPYAFPASQRRIFLQELATMLPDYDTALAEARIDAEGKEWPEIIRIFEQLTENYPGNRQYRGILEAVKKAAPPGEIL